MGITTRRSSAINRTKEACWTLINGHNELEENRKGRNCCESLEKVKSTQKDQEPQISGMQLENTVVNRTISKVKQAGQRTRTKILFKFLEKKKSWISQIPCFYKGHILSLSANHILYCSANLVFSSGNITWRYVNSCLWWGETSLEVPSLHLFAGRLYFNAWFYRLCCSIAGTLSRLSTGIKLQVLRCTYSLLVAKFWYGTLIREMNTKKQSNKDIR